MAHKVSPCYPLQVLVTITFLQTDVDDSLRFLTSIILAFGIFLSQIGAAKALIESCRCAEAKENGESISCHHTLDQQEDQETLNGAKWYLCTCHKSGMLLSLPSYIGPQEIFIVSFLDFLEMKSIAKLGSPFDTHRVIDPPPPRV